jgi:hypothetical protein
MGNSLIKNGFKLEKKDSQNVYLIVDEPPPNLWRDKNLN